VLIAKHTIGVGTESRYAWTAFHHELQAALADGLGLVVVTGPAGQGKTTAIEQALAAPTSPADIAFLGDLRGDIDLAARAVHLARSQVVLAVLRITCAAGAFGRLVDMGVAPRAVAEVVRVAFTTRLIRTSSEPILLHERLVVTEAIRRHILAGADWLVIHRQGIADGMRSLRRTGLDHVTAGRLTPEIVAGETPDD